MRAIQIDRFGGPTVLEVREVPNPVPAAGELLVRTTASSINPVDVKTRSRVYETGIPPLPMMLGWDLAGMVADRGTTVLRPGQRVIAMSPQLAAGAGTWADLVALPAGLVAPAPATVSLGEAATLPLAGLTAWQALDWLRLGVGDRLLVTGGAGASADSCSRSPRTAELPWTPCSIPAPTRRPLSSSGHFLPAATGGRVRYAQACAHRIMAGRRRVSDGAGRFATAISVCEIRVHIGLICAGALAQPVRRTTARNRRSGWISQRTASESAHSLLSRAMASMSTVAGQILMAVHSQGMLTAGSRCRTPPAPDPARREPEPARRPPGAGRSPRSRQGSRRLLAPKALGRLRRLRCRCS